MDQRAVIAAGVIEIPCLVHMLLRILGRTTKMLSFLFLFFPVHSVAYDSGFRNANIESASIPQLSLAELERRIENLTPQYEIHLKLNEKIELFGYDIEPVNASSGISRSTHISVLRQGWNYSMTYYLRIFDRDLPGFSILTQLGVIQVDEHGKKIRDLGNEGGSGYEQKLVVARQAFQITPGNIGEVVKQHCTFRVPLSADLGTQVLQIALVHDHSKEAPEFTEIGNVYIDLGKETNTEHMTNKRMGDTGVVNGNNRIRNPSFEGELGENNWMIYCWNPRRPGAVTSVDTSCAVHGKNSLRVDFGGGIDVNYYHMLQTVSVKPNSTYILSFWVKTEDVTSNSGPRVDLYDGINGTGYFHTYSESFLGTSDWRFIRHQFTPPDRTSSLIIRIARVGSPNKEWWNTGHWGVIGGTIWVDSFQLVEAEKWN